METTKKTLEPTKVTNELVINATEKGGRIALLRDKSLIELHYDDEARNFNVGDIFLGTVRKVVPGLNAAFIDVGFEKDAFLHYFDLGPNVGSLNKYVKLVQKGNTFGNKLANFKMSAPIDKHGKMSEVLKPNQRVLVQIDKEPISTKGPRLSCELSLAGRYLVLVPFSNTVNVSRKITSLAERKRLQKLILSIKPENFGVIIRTVAEGRDVAELDRDLTELLDKWKAGVETLKTAQPRQKVIGELNRASSMLRDMFDESFDSITVDSKDVYKDVKNYIASIAPAKENIVKLYNGKTKIFENYGIEKQIKSLFGQSVSLPNGGYLIIEHTEALHVIDVNSGNKSNKLKDQETTSLMVNLEAASEIARQLRLRDMGGIIVIDFIDMRKADDKKAVFQHIKKEMASDRSKYTILPISKFGLMQITRQRVRPEINIKTREKCITCNGTGKVNATINITDLIEEQLHFILDKQNEKGITLSVHPFLYAYYTKGFISKQIKWFFKYKKWVKLEEDTSLGLTDYVFRNKLDEEIEF